MEEEPNGEEEEKREVAAQGRAVFVDAGLDRTGGEGAIGVGAEDNVVMRVEWVGHGDGGQSESFMAVRNE